MAYGIERLVHTEGQGPYAEDRESEQGKASHDFHEGVDGGGGGFRWLCD